MKTKKLKYFYVVILICVLVLNVLMSVPTAQTISGVKRLEEGMAAYEQGEYDNAVFRLEMAVYQMPEEEKGQLWDAHFYLGISNMLLGNTDEVREEFVTAQGIIKNKVPDVLIHSPKIVRFFKDAQLSQSVNVLNDPVTYVPEIKFRSTPNEHLSAKSVIAMLKDKGFYERQWNNSASGFRNNYILQNDSKVVYDRASGLMWQQSGSDQVMKYENAKAYIMKLNSDRLAGYNDWRLPTLEEAMSLMETSVKNGDLYVTSVFGKSKPYIWTSDKYSVSSAWVVDFINSYCFYDNIFNDTSVRAVR